MTNSRGTAAADHPAPSAAARPARAPTAISGRQVLVLLLVLLAMAIAGVASRGVTAPVGADAPPERFSAVRAAEAVAPLVAAPRPVGSAANDRAHEELAAQLTALGFTTRTEEGIGARTYGSDATTGYVRNLVATRPGTAPTGTIVLATHIDSVPNAPGAADAGVGLAVILETVRALGPEAQRNDLVLLLVDGEERGLLGAEAFLGGAAQELRAPVVVLNHEARGVSGRPLMTRASGPMHTVVDAAPRPEFESFTEALFEIIPNDTDFTVYRGGGWWGLDMAIIDDSWAYHSAQDDAAHLDPGTLQHYGDLTLALTRDLAARDLGALQERAGEEPVQTTAPWGVVAVPPGMVSVLGVLSPLLVLAAVVLLRRRGELTARGVAAGALVALIVLVLAVLAAVQLWKAAGVVSPQMLSQSTREPVHAELFVLAELLAAAAVAGAGWVLARRWLSRAALVLGASILVTALLAVLAVVSPALAGWVVLPAAIAAIGTPAAALLPPLPALVVRAVALLPTGWLLGTQLSALAEFGIASSAGGIAGTALIGLGAAAALFATAAGERSVRRPRRLLAPVLLAVLAVGASIGGTAVTLASPEPTQERVIAHVDGADGATRWEVTGSTEWGRRLDGVTGTSPVPVPTVQVTESGPGHMQVAVTAPREASALELTVSAGGLSAVRIDGTPLDSAEPLRTLQIHGVRAGQTVVIDAAVEAGAELTVVETSYDPSLADGWIDPGAGVSLMQPRMQVSVTAPVATP
ncbi:M28 family peptidase [Brachybacterium sp. UNK5269]|uniref:M28 family peptidase n=1 Tax=Brachybacterium sp. UNK5269 TaxID=3408576 RepID=UPI003BB0BF7B